MSRIPSLHNSVAMMQTFETGDRGRGTGRHVHVPCLMSHVSRLAQTVLGLSLLLTAVGCSANYNGERLFWKAKRLSVPIGNNPSKATPEQVTAARAAYDRVIAHAPGTPWAGRSQLAVGSLYAMQKEYAKARDAYALVLQNYNAMQDICLAARVAIAKTHELEQHWKEAVSAYRDIAGYHPWSVSGLEAPLYIARLYEQQQEAAEATKAYERAIRIYNKLLLDAPTPEAATQVKSFLVVADQRLEKWDDAIHILQDLIATPAGTNRPLAILTLAAIYQTKLHDAAQAQAAFAKLAQEFPEHPLGKAAKAQLERMGLPAEVSAQAGAALSHVPVLTQPPATPAATH